MHPEIGLFLAAIEGGCERVVHALDGLDADAIHWTPAPGANSLAAITKHSLANAERNVLMTFASEAYEWRRDEEFRAEDETARSLQEGWTLLQQRLRASLEEIPGARLEETLQHLRMGAVSGRAVLLQAARHVSEHAGAAELTRELLTARQAG